MNKRIGLVCVFSLLMISLVFASSVVRQLPESVSPGARFTVSIAVDLTGDDDSFMVVETYPANFIASNPNYDAGLSGGEVRWAEFALADKQHVLTYELVAPSAEGTYTFSGTYRVSPTSSTGVPPEQNITGDNSIVVRSGSTVPSCGDGLQNGSETCVSCPVDVVCGVGRQCNATTATCVDITLCGNGSVDVDETCVSCPVDVVCGVGRQCNTTTATCVNTIGSPVCGNGNCDGTEDCSSCSSDCGSCPITNSCGDSFCSDQENCFSCPNDCNKCAMPIPGVGNVPTETIIFVCALVVVILLVIVFLVGNLRNNEVENALQQLKR